MLNVSPTRVSQYLKTGLPQLRNGLLDRTAALTWLATYKTSGKNRDKGPALALALLGEATAKQPDVEDAASALAALICGLGKISARMAVAAGAPMKVAFSLEYMISWKAYEAALDLFPEPARSRLENESSWPFEATVYDPDADKAFWRDLAKEAGEPHDESAWEAHREKLAWMIAHELETTRNGEAARLRRETKEPLQ